MILFDTDQLTVWASSGHSRYGTLVDRMTRSPDQDFAACAFRLEEHLPGRLAVVHRQSKIHDQIQTYLDLSEPSISTRAGKS